MLIVIRQVANHEMSNSPNWASRASVFCSERRLRSWNPPELGGLDHEPASSSPGGIVFQRDGRTCRASFVQFRHGSRLRATRRRSQALDRSKDGTHHRAGNGDVGELEGIGPCMAHDASPDLNQLGLKAGQRPVGHSLGQFDAAQERGQVEGQCVQLQPHIVVAETFARQP